MNSRPHALGEQPLDLEVGRLVGELRHADHADVVGQERAAAGERIAAARRRQHASAATSSRFRMVRTAPAYLTTMLTSLPPATITFTTVLPAMCAATAGSASAASRMLVLRAVGRHGHPAADLAVDLHRDHDLVGPGDLGVEAPASGANTMPPSWPSVLPQLLGHVRRERRQHQDQRLDRLLEHGRVSGRSPAAASAAPAGGPVRVCWSENA